MAAGIKPRALAPAEAGRQSVGLNSIPVILSVNCVSGTDTYALFSSNAPNGFRVIDCWGIMTGAGAGADTFKLDDGTNDISDTVDLSSAGDTDRVAVGEIDDAYYEVEKNGSLRVVTASDATLRVFVMIEWRD